MKKYKIAFLLSNGDVSDRKQWSGIPYSVHQQLKTYFDVEFIRVDGSKWMKKGLFLWKCMLRLIGKRYVDGFSVWLSKSKAKELAIVDKRNDIDAYFIIGSDIGAFFETKKPVFYLTDAVFGNMTGYYESFSNLTKSNVRSAEVIQRNMLNRAKATIVASNWARKGVTELYHVSDEKVEVVCFGANIEDEIRTRKKDKNHINLLFIGVEWKRKGGDIAIECIRELKKKDRKHTYTLHIVGCYPPYKIKDKDIEIHGFLNKNNIEERQKFISLIEDSDLFLLPTQAECAGIVFCESCAYGIPSLTYNTGGTADYVRNNVNGFCLETGSTGVQFADKILEILSDEKLLDNLKQNARKMYEEELNWNVWGEKVQSIILSGIRE